LNPLRLAGRKAENSDKWFPAIRDAKVYLLDSSKDRDALLNDDGELVKAADKAWTTQDNLVGKNATRLGEEILKLGPVPEADAVVRMRQDLPAMTLRVETARRAGENMELARSLGSRSFAYVLLNQPDEAIRDSEEALGLAADLNWVRVNFADALLLKGKFDEAMKIYKALSDKQKPSADGLLCLDIRDDVSQMSFERLIGKSVMKRVLGEVPCPVAGRN
jgi:tetratricopeptide (TPR) repeat protein